MNEKEKRFKISKIEEYQNNIGSEKIEIEKRTTQVFITSLLAIKFLSAAVHSAQSLKDVSLYILSALGGASLVLSLAALKKMVTSICKKTILESKAQDLIDELEPNNMLKGVR